MTIDLYQQSLPTDDHAVAIPVLASLNIEQSADYYEKKLGFLIDYQDEAYLIVSRDQMELHFWLAKDPIFPQNTSCYIRGGQILSLYAEFKDKMIEGLSEIAYQPWGMVEFHLHDVHGNVLRFGKEADEGQEVA